jgi:hypothetical protein
VTRYTFLVHAYPGGASMLENLSTHERIRVSDLAAVGPQIESWLAGLARSEAHPRDPPGAPAAE